MKICIDAGHNYSGYDTGAEGNGLREQDVTFKIAQSLNSYLQSIGIATVMTRPTLGTNLGYGTNSTTGVNSSLNERCNIANRSSCDYFISIHCNSVPSTSANGTEVLIIGKGGKSEELAELVCKSIVDNIGTTNRGVKVQNVKVLKDTIMPAILVETAFISNASDAELLKNKVDDFARAIFWGICEHLGIEIYKELETVNDIVWELNYRGIISNPSLWLSKLKEDENAYWLARKCINYIRKGK